MTGKREPQKRESRKARLEREAYEAHMQQRKAERIVPPINPLEPSGWVPPPSMRDLGEVPDDVEAEPRPPLPRGPRPASPIERPARELARTVDVETSHEAAAANRLGKQTHRRLALEIHGEHPNGLIDDEVSALSDGVLDVHEATRRCLDLRHLPEPLLEWLLHEDGEPVTRLTRSNRRARVSVLTLAGRFALEAGS